MKQFYAYIRVSTAKQGEQGVSLQEQRAAITHYAQRNDLPIAAWFEERETAAKCGRRIFSEMLGHLQQGKATGVIIHKIDRSARNFKDWAEIGELIDRGIEVKFVNESLDLNTRGGRLSADIQAVVAADFIRNLREETRKGFYGRLKQGFLPAPAPLGYLDRGGGQVKRIDPVKGPLVRKAFELYSTGRFNLETLAEELQRLGLRNKGGGRVSMNGLSVILNNPFYAGIIRLRSTGETFPGSHEPLVSAALFRRVQEILAGKTNARPFRHHFLFRRLLTCKACGYSLIGELQKGHVYYRCHTRDCTTKGVREESVEGKILRTLEPLDFNDREKRDLAQRLTRLRDDWKDSEQSRREILGLRAGRLEDRLARLTDAYLDGTIEKELFEERKKTLLLERQNIRDQLASESQQSLPDRLAEFLELAGSAYVSYKMGLPEEKRDLLRIITSNRLVEGKLFECSLISPFAEVATRHQERDGTPHRGIPRIWDALLRRLGKWLSQNPEVVLERRKQDNKPREVDKGLEVAA